MFPPTPLIAKQRVGSTKTHNGAIIQLTNSSFFSESSVSYNIDEYDVLNLHLTEDTHILNYMDLSEIKFEDIGIRDIIVYEGNIEYITGNERRISSGNILVLKRTDLSEMTMEQYKDITELKDVNIVYECNLFLYGKLYTKTFRGDEFIDFFKMEISDDTIIENDKTKKYADIVFKNPFEYTVKSENKDSDGEKDIHEILKITYK